MLSLYMCTLTQQLYNSVVVKGYIASYWLYNGYTHCIQKKVLLLINTISINQ